MRAPELGAVLEAANGLFRLCGRLSALRALSWFSFLYSANLL